MVTGNILTGAALAFAIPAYAAGNRGNMAMVDTVSRNVLASSGWAVSDEAVADRAITLQIGLTLQNEEGLIGALKDVSDPKSPNYGKYLEREDVNKLAGPAAGAAEAVTKWLKDSGVTEVAPTADGHWISFKTTVNQANELLNADFQAYSNEGVTKIRTPSYAVPMDIQQHVDLIHPTTFFGKTQKFHPVEINLAPTDEQAMEELEKRQATDLKGQFAVDAACKTAITPACLKQMYNLGNYKADPAAGSKVAFGSFLNETSSNRDFALFLKQFGIADRKVTKINVNDAPDNQAAGSNHGEANLDAQIQAGIADPLPITEYLTGGSPPLVPDLDVKADDNTNEPYVPYYQFLLSKKNSELPQAISNSYGEPEQTIPVNYAKRTCTMIAMMGLRGITVFESSGDTGVGSNCKSNDGSNRDTFNPQFPGSCPWITAIGGTEAVAPEISWRDSSGGFSNVFPRPWYQEAAVSEYLNKSLPQATADYYKPYFNAAGRGFPDVSAHSLTPNYQIYTNGQLRGSGGTSAAAPLWAALASLLNDARLRAKKPTMGFLNPWLYSQGKDFLIDITEGNTRGCDGTNHQTGTVLPGGGKIPYASWNGTVGWDPATGLGIPDFQKMVKAAMAAVGGTVPT